MMWLTKHTLRGVLAIGVLTPGVWACASKATTPQLVDARRAYDNADNSTTRERAPHELGEARGALDRAEQAHDANPGSAREANLATHAERKARVAEVRGEARDARAEDREGARTAAQRDAEDRREDRAELRAEHAELRADRAEAQADAERDAHHPAANAQRDVPARRSEPAREREATAALQSLSSIADVKQEPRGVVITLAGSLLFPTGRDEMSPIAQRSVDQVAHALASQPADATFQVEGHTDNSGSEAQNERLARKRAQAVADELIESGIDPSRIQVVGRGETHPIASNDTDSGRAANRRVEIVVSEQQG